MGALVRKGAGTSTPSGWILQGRHILVGMVRYGVLAGDWIHHDWRCSPWLEIWGNFQHVPASIDGHHDFRRRMWLWCRPVYPSSQHLPSTAVDPWISSSIFSEIVSLNNMIMAWLHILGIPQTWTQHEGMLFWTKADLGCLSSNLITSKWGADFCAGTPLGATWKRGLRLRAWQKTHNKNEGAWLFWQDCVNGEQWGNEHFHDTSGCWICNSKFKSDQWWFHCTNTKVVLQYTCMYMYLYMIYSFDTLDLANGDWYWSAGRRCLQSFDGSCELYSIHKDMIWLINMSDWKRED